MAAVAFAIDSLRKSYVVATQADFVKIVSFTLRPDIEGEASSDPDDAAATTPGAVHTKFGITQSTYNRYRRNRGLRAEAVSKLTRLDAEVIYHEDYWLGAKCHALPRALAMSQFECAVNPGIASGTLLLQWVVGGLKLDGKIGPKTIAAANAVPDSLRAALDQITARAGYHIGRTDARKRNEKFLRGWAARNEKLRVFLRESTCGSGSGRRS